MSVIIIVAAIVVVVLGSVLLRHSLRLSLEKRQLEQQLEGERKLREQQGEMSAQNEAHQKEMMTTMTQGAVMQLAAKSQEQINENGVQFAALSKRAMADIIEPLKAEIKEYAEEVRRVKEGNAKLGEQMGLHLQSLQATAAVFGKEAKGFTEAFTRGNKVQGDFGEHVLEAIYERAGLKRGVNFVVQTGNDGSIPDSIVFDDVSKRAMIVDSKASYTDYLAAFNAEDDDARKAALKRHVASIKKHIKELADKEYPQMRPVREGYEYLPLVAMFVPNEKVLDAALEVEPELMQEAYDKGVVLVTPLTILGYFWLVKEGWKRQELDKNAEKIAKMASTLVDRLDSAFVQVEQMGKALDTMGECHRKLSTLMSNCGDAHSIADMALRIGKLAEKKSGDVRSRVLKEGLTIAVCLVSVACGAATWPGFECGMGIGGWLTNYKRFNVLPEEKRLVLTEGDYAHFDSYITEGDIARIKHWGFDHIRLGFDQIVLEEKPGVYRDRTFRKIDDFIGWCGKHKMNVVLNLHKAIGNYCDITEKVQLLDDDKLQLRFIDLWLEVERRYHDFPGLAFEILNEVRDVDPEKWNALADRTIKAIREKNPDRWIVVGSTMWNSVETLEKLKVWDDPRVIYTFHEYSPYHFTHQRGVLQAPALFRNAEVAAPSAKEVAEHLAPAAKWCKEHPDKILWNGEFGTIRHANPMARVSFMRDVVGFCRREGIPYCVWNYLSTPNDGNRFSLVDDDTRDFLSDALLDACLGRGDPADDGRMTFMSFNLWGAHFKNPIYERDLKEAVIIRRNEPDIVCCQETMQDFWSSRFFGLLATDYGVVRSEGHSEREFNPILYRKTRLELVDGGTEVFAAADNPEGSKGFGWGVFRDRTTGRRFIACSTHLWWKQGEVRHDEMRVRNAKELLAKAAELRAKYGKLPLFVLGDMNSTENDRKSGKATPLAEFGKAGLADAQYTTQGASQWSSHHGDPKRDSRGNLRGWIKADASDPGNSLDHIFYSAAAVEPLELVVDRSQDALECSDHSPVKFTFRLR